MVYTPANRDYGAEAESHLPRNLFIVVAVLGLASYGASFGPTGDAETPGWYVRFAALAGLVAALSLLSRRAPLPIMTATLAAVGFLDALSSVVSTSDRGWALTVIVVLNALQAAAAVAALLMSPKAATGSTAGYEAYVDYYNQAVRQYYSQQAHSSTPGQSQRSGHAQADANAQATAHAQRTQRPSQYADYGELDYGGPHGSADHDSGGVVPGRPAGLPSFGQAPTYADQTRRDTGESAPPSSPY